MGESRTARLAVAAAVAACLAALAPAGAPAAGAIPALGRHAATTDPGDVAGATPHGGGWAVPLRARRPDWYTRALRSRVIEAAGRPVAAPDDAPLPSEVGIRPGAWQIEPYGCTMNFVFRKGSALGIGTAGHCVDRVGQNVVLLTLAPGGANPVLVDVGTVVARHENGIGDDFALVAIRPALHRWVSPTIAVIAGPCGSYYGSGPQLVTHYGHGLAIGTGGTPRVGLALTWRDDAFGWDGAGIFGDSGSPVRLGGLKAAGNLTHLVVSGKWLPSFVTGTRIGKMLRIAGGWSLASSPLCA